MTNTRHAELEAWWQTPLGQTVAEAEQELLTRLTSPFYGFFQLQMGGIESLPALNRTLSTTLLAQRGDIYANTDALPFKSHSIDNLLMVHILEFATDPHQVLREAERVLTADGKLVLCCFNPVSLWGLRRLFSMQDVAPWHGHFFSQTRIRDWLSLLNFEVIEHHRVLFRAPFKNEKWLRRWQFIERWGKRFWPLLGGVSVIVASKRSIPLTPVREEWRKRRLFPSPSLVNKPITRDNHNG